MAKSAYNEIEETKEEETNVHFVKKNVARLADEYKLLRKIVADLLSLLRIYLVVSVKKGILVLTRVCQTEADRGSPNWPTIK